MERGVQKIELADGQTVLARVSVLELEELPPDDDPFPHKNVGALDRLATRVEQLNELVRGVGTAVLGAAKAVAPDEVSATFGIELAVKPGKALAILADGEAKAAIEITLTWNLGGDPATP
ncbi:CU044_2847 family protein [Streptomyces sp. bgisy027]|uniref:CU044_2847 family protein n=1 Tax=unclassified Streptomyces TaxID=2593676 RepID=UPI003D760F36